MAKWVLLDDDDKPIRYFDYPAEGAIEIVKPVWVVDWNDYLEALL